jgi:hypothetical protein
VYGGDREDNKLKTCVACGFVHPWDVGCLEFKAIRKQQDAVDDGPSEDDTYEASSPAEEEVVEEAPVEEPVKEEAVEEPVDLEELTVKELKEIAKEEGIHGYSSMHKDDLVWAILEAETEK